MQKLLEHYLAEIVAFVASLLPGMLGSLVAVIYEREPGLTAVQRLAQWFAGIIVSYYAGRGIAAVWSWDGFGAQSLQFVAGMIAFKAAPRFIAKASDVIGDLPVDLRDRFLPRKDRP